MRLSKRENIQAEIDTFSAEDRDTYQILRSLIENDMTLDECRSSGQG